MNINIITPCSRPIYLPVIAYHLRLLTNFNIRWFIGFEVDSNQATPPGRYLGCNFQQFFKERFQSSPGFEILCCVRNSESESYNGTAQRNEALEKITEPDDWVAFLDDDTLLPHNYEAVVTNAILGRVDVSSYKTMSYRGLRCEPPGYVYNDLSLCMDGT